MKTLLKSQRYIDEYRVAWVTKSAFHERSDGTEVYVKPIRLMSETTQDLDNAKAAERLLLGVSSVAAVGIQVRTVRQERRWHLGGTTWETTGMTRWFDGENAPFEVMLQEGM